jgi:hypothetical protein
VKTRQSILIPSLLLLVSAPALAGTAWEAYIKAPSAAGAAMVREAMYTEQDGRQNNVELDLKILEYEVAAGEPEAAMLAVRLRHQFELSADISEYLDEIIGRAIRPNPSAFLEAIARESGCPGVYPTGDLFVDRDELRAAEIDARSRALGRVTDAALLAKRDQCIAKLRDL